MDDPLTGLSLPAFRPTERFSDRAGDYVRHRPSYPDRAIDLVLGGLGDPAWLVAADVGAGTGISARLLADRGVLVHAVEPNRAMREAAEPHPRVRWSGARAEATGLPEGGLDLVCCAQAFHWFDLAPTLAEFARILRPGGRLALLWNEGDPADAPTAAYYRLVDAAAGEGVRSIRAWTFDPEAVAASGRFTRPQRTDVPNAQALDEEGLVGRALSASYVPRSGPAADALVAGLREVHRAHRDAAGLVRLRYVTAVWLAEALPYRSTRAS